MDSGREQNYWPGFVDALSNVVLTLIFVLVIFVFALVMASNKVEERRKEIVETEKTNKGKEMVEASTRQQTQAELVELRKQLQQAQEQLKNAQTYNEGKSTDKQVDTGSKSQASKSDVDDSKQLVIERKAEDIHQGSAYVLKNNDNKLIVNFPETTTDIDDKSAASFDGIVGPIKAKLGKTKVIIRSILGRETYSAAQRLAYYRALAVRNYLITKQNISPDLISSTIVKPDTPQDGHVEILFNKE